MLIQVFLRPLTDVMNFRDFPPATKPNLGLWDLRATPQVDPKTLWCLDECAGLTLGSVD